MGQLQRRPSRALLSTHARRSLPNIHQRSIDDTMRLIGTVLALLPLLAAAQSTTKSAVAQGDAVLTNPANDIPIFKPSKATQPDAALKLDPLARVMPFPVAEGSVAPPTTTPPLPTRTTGTVKPNLRSSSPPQTATPTTLPVPTMPANTTCSGAACNQPGTSYDFSDIATCATANVHGPIAVSVAGKGTFCAFAPVCSGSVPGNCPGVQTGLNYAASCKLLDGGVYGCVG